MIRAVIIEDEAQNLERLSNLLKIHCSEVVIAGDAPGVEKAFELINRINPELVFLDIQLTDGTGFSLLKKFEKIKFKLIFVTAYEKFAVQAFRFSALDFLLKPVDPDELIEAVNKAKEQIMDQTSLQISQASEDFQSKGFDKIILRDFENIHLVKLSEIAYCKADGNYSEFHLTGCTTLVVSKNLKEYESMLSGSGFLRIHRSYLANMKHFKKLEKAEGGTVVLSDGSELPLASGKKEDLLRYLEQFTG